MKKISVIGAGNVGSIAAMRIAEETSLNITLVDIAGDLANGKALDLEDSRYILKKNYNFEGTHDIERISGSSIVVITAGLTRKPGMLREDLIAKNAAILKEVSLHIKNLAPEAVVIVVTNPLDLMTRLALQVTGFAPNRVFGMGITLDASRFANLISRELNIPVTEIEAVVIGSHGEGMLPLPRFTTIKGVELEQFIDENRIKKLVNRTIMRGQEIVTLLGSGSAFFAPSAAIAALVRAVIKDEKRIVGVSAYLNGEYGLKDVCIGVPARLGKGGIEQIIELVLDYKEREALLKSANLLKEQYSQINGI